MPGDSETKLRKAPGFGADVVIADLEDSVVPAGRAGARVAVGAWIQELGQSGEGSSAAGRRPPASPNMSAVEGAGARPGIWVRVNPGPELADDLDAVVMHGLEGVVLPKCGSAADVERLDDLLSIVEERGGMAPGSVRVAALVESARGVLAAREIAAGQRVVRLHLGEADLCADLGLRPRPDGAELVTLRVGIVLASAAAGIEAPIGPVHTGLDDEAGLARSSAALADLGFGGRSVVHPRQVEVANAAFTPSPGEVQRARDLIERFEEHRRSSAGVFVDSDGQMVDEAVVRAARRVLQRSV